MVSSHHRYGEEAEPPCIRKTSLFFFNCLLWDIINSYGMGIPFVKTKSERGTERQYKSNNKHHRQYLVAVRH